MTTAPNTELLPEQVIGSDEEKALYDLMHEHCKESMQFAEERKAHLLPVTLAYSLTRIIARAGYTRTPSPSASVAVGEDALEASDVEALIGAYDFASERGLPITAIKRNIEIVRELLKATPTHPTLTEEELRRLLHTAIKGDYAVGGEEAADRAAQALIAKLPHIVKHDLREKGE